MSDDFEGIWNRLGLYPPAGPEIRRSISLGAKYDTTTSFWHTGLDWSGITADGHKRLEESEASWSLAERFLLAVDGIINMADAKDIDTVPDWARKSFEEVATEWRRQGGHRLFKLFWYYEDGWCPICEQHYLLKSTEVSWWSSVTNGLLLMVGGSIPHLCPVCGEEFDWYGEKYAKRKGFEAPIVDDSNEKDGPKLSFDEIPFWAKPRIENFCKLWNKSKKPEPWDYWPIPEGTYFRIVHLSMKCHDCGFKFLNTGVDMYWQNAKAVGLWLHAETCPKCDSHDLRDYTKALRRGFDAPSARKVGWNKVPTWAKNKFRERWVTLTEEDFQRGWVYSPEWVERTCENCGHMWLSSLWHIFILGKERSLNFVEKDSIRSLERVDQGIVCPFCHDVERYKPVGETMESRRGFEAPEPRVKWKDLPKWAREHFLADEKFHCKIIHTHTSAGEGLEDCYYAPFWVEEVCYGCGRMWLSECYRLFVDDDPKTGGISFVERNANPKDRHVIYCPYCGDTGLKEARQIGVPRVGFEAEDDIPLPPKVRWDDVADWARKLFEHRTGSPSNMTELYYAKSWASRACQSCRSYWLTEVWKMYEDEGEYACIEYVEKPGPTEDCPFCGDTKFKLLLDLDVPRVGFEAPGGRVEVDALPVWAKDRIRRNRVWPPQTIEYWNDYLYEKTWVERTCYTCHKTWLVEFWLAIKKGDTTGWAFSIERYDWSKCPFCGGRKMDIGKSNIQRKGYDAPQAGTEDEEKGVDCYGSTFGKGTALRFDDLPMWAREQLKGVEVLVEDPPLAELEYWRDWVRHQCSHCDKTWLGERIQGYITDVPWDYRVNKTTLRVVAQRNGEFYEGRTPGGPFFHTYIVCPFCHTKIYNPDPKRISWDTYEERVGFDAPRVSFPLKYKELPPWAKRSAVEFMEHIDDGKAVRNVTDLTYRRKWVPRSCNTCGKTWLSDIFIANNSHWYIERHRRDGRMRCIFCGAEDCSARMDLAMDERPSFDTEVP